MSSIDWSQWINFKDYTPLELFLFAGGCSLWVVVYCIFIKNIFTKQYLEMPVFAGCADIGWEFTWSFLAATNMGLLLERTYQVWFLTDILIFYGLLRYGWKQLTFERGRGFYVPACIFATVAWVAGVYAMHVSGLDEPIGATSAYLDQLCISFLYIPLLLRQKSLENFSFSAAWLRTIGTGMNTVFMNIHYPDNYFLRFIATLATTLDFTYVYLFWRMRRELGQSAQDAERMASSSVQAA
ncbi:MAG TPA: hypothetical protein VKM72_00070 [Thermoanaerobaculia bacterium]|nr:hypothetical protein [Thermoanaerobaculia bacterium]